MQVILCNKVFVSLGLQYSLVRRVARNSQWGGGCFWGLGAELPAAGGNWGSGSEAQPPEAQGTGGGAPSARTFSIFLQN